MNLKTAIGYLPFHKSLRISIGQSTYETYKRVSVGAGHAREPLDRGHGPLLQVAKQKNFAQASSAFLGIKKSRYYFLLLLAGAMGSAQATEFNQVQVGKSTLTFAYRQMGVPLEGKFGKFTAQLAFDPARINAAQARLEADLSSIDTGSSEGNDEVSGKLWFNTKAYPAAQFVSSGVKTLGGNRYEALGKLTIKGRSLDVSAPFTFRQEGAVGIFDGAFTLKRLDYAIGEGLWADVGAVADEVRIVFHIVTNAAPPAKK